MAPRYPQVYVPLMGEDGNAFAIMGRVVAALRKAGVPRAEADAYLHEAMQGDYDHLLTVTLNWVTEGSPDDEDLPFMEMDPYPEGREEEYDE